MEQTLDITLNRGSTVTPKRKHQPLSETFTVEPRFNEVPRDWGNLFVISRFCSIDFTLTLAGLENNYRSLHRGLRYIEVR